MSFSVTAHHKANAVRSLVQYLFSTCAALILYNFMNAQLSVLENLIVCAVACIPIILVDPIARRFTSGWKKISESDPREHGEEVDCGALVFTLTFGGSLFSVMSMCVIFVLILSRAITAQIFLECFAVIATIGIGIDLTILTAPLIGTETSRRSP